MKQYITANRYKNQIYVRELVDGVEYRRKVRFQPYLFQRSSKPTEYKDFYGNQFVKKVSFQNPFEMREHIEMYKDIPGELWGNKDVVAQFMYDEKYDCFDFSNLIVSYLDIEVCTRSKGANGEWVDGGFPEASEAKFPINAICDYRSDTKKYHTFTTARGWTMSKSQLKYADEVEYIYCKDEQDLLKKWLSFWVKSCPHIVTGWNCLSVNSNIWTNDKIVSLSDIKKGDNLVDSVVLNKSNVSIKREHVINLINGQTINCSKEHIFPVYVKNAEHYTNFCSKNDYTTDLTVADIMKNLDEGKDVFILTPKHENLNADLTYRKIFSSNIELLKDICSFDEEELRNGDILHITFNKKNKIEVVLDEVISDDVFRVLGLIYTDGSYCRSEKSLDFTNTNVGLIEYYASVLDKYKKQSRMKPMAIKRASNKNGSWLSYRITFNNVIGMLCYLLFYNREGKKCLNTSNCSMLSKHQFMMFMSGCIDGDGSVTSNSITFSSFTNNGIVPDVKKFQELLLWNGYYTNSNNNLIRFYNRDNERLMNDLCLKHSLKSEKIKALVCGYFGCLNTKAKIVSHRELENYHIVKVIDVRDTNNDVEMLDIETDTHYFYANGMKTHNCALFDIPYIINRLKILFGADIASRISPFNVIEQKEVSSGFGNKMTTYKVMGVAILDYLDMYKKYRYIPREKYTLDFISKAENPEEHKLEFRGTHGSLYYDDPVFFVDYNVQDVRCVVNFEKKLQMLQLCTYLSYFSNINFEDNYSPIKIWETIIAKSCLDEGIVVPMRFKTPEKKPYEGAYVHEPVPGLKGCIASFDYTSLYPKIMELFYIGADVHQTGENKERLFKELLKVLDEGDEKCHSMLTEIKLSGIFNDFYINNDMPKEVTDFLKERGVSLTTNCEFYDVSKKSIFISLITKLFLERKSDKKTSFKFKHQAQEIREELKKRGIEVSEEH